jgi:hypothetical protein
MDGYGKYEVSKDTLYLNFIEKKQKLKGRNKIDYSSPHSADSVELKIKVINEHSEPGMFVNYIVRAVHSSDSTEILTGGSTDFFGHSTIRLPRKEGKGNIQFIYLQTETIEVELDLAKNAQLEVMTHPKFSLSIVNQTWQMNITEIKDSSFFLDDRTALKKQSKPQKFFLISESNYILERSRLPADKYFTKDTVQIDLFTNIIGPNQIELKYGENYLLYLDENDLKFLIEASGNDKENEQFLDNLLNQENNSIATMKYDYWLDKYLSTLFSLGKLRIYDKRKEGFVPSMFSTVKEYGSMIDREYTSPSGESLFYENLMITYSMPMLRENKPEKE